MQRRTRRIQWTRRLRVCLLSSASGGAPLMRGVMPETESASKRFRELRERAGLSHDEAAKRMGVSSACIWDIESFEGELASCYSPYEVRHFCEVLGVRP